MKRILYRDAAGKQQSLRLGKCSERAAQTALAGFERVLEANRLGSTLHPDGVHWLEGINDRLHARVVKLGMTEPRKSAAVVTLGMLLDRFDAAAVVKASTIAARKQTTSSLRKYLIAETPLDTITMADADRWRKAIADEKLAGPTIAKRVHVAKAIFRKGVKWGLIASNPFEDLKAGSQANPERAHYVTPETIAAVLDKCPDDQWRAVVALTRYAGLRCPSEIVGLRWGDVNWERGRLTVRSPKTAGHGEAHAVRVVPIGPELRPILLTLFEQAERGTEAVVPRLHDPTMNLRTTFTKIIDKAGEKPWARLFHNLRASCACDWVERFPAHVVAGWLGHSPLIAAQHYLQTRDAHFDMAAGKGEAAAIPATQAPQSDTTASQPETQNPQNPADLVGVGVGCDSVEKGKWAILGSNQ